MTVSRRNNADNGEENHVIQQVYDPQILAQMNQIVIDSTPVLRNWILDEINIWIENHGPNNNIHGICPLPAANPSLIFERSGFGILLEGGLLDSRENHTRECVREALGVFHQNTNASFWVGPEAETFGNVRAIPYPGGFRLIVGVGLWKIHHVTGNDGVDFSIL